ncbi:MAG TPA: argininosuccinate synthase-related protein [Thermoanaerobaculia bacterium]|jgi:argininosuccinate synthase|nr:argininosuccinate synthase-related protein [Thermoanaerobaculia bacterium]
MGPSIRNLQTLRAVLSGGNTRPVCLFSGGLDGTYLLYLLSKYGCKDVTALTVDVGGELDPDAVHYVGKQLGVRCIILDRREELARDFVIPAIAAQGAYLGGHPISASLTRPMMAKIAAEVAAEHGCNVVIHTSNRSQNSLRRFNGALAALGFPGAYGSPFDRGSISREEKMAELRAAGVQLPVNRSASSDSNFWSREFESGDLDDPEHLELPEALYYWTKPSGNTSPARLTIRFEGGVPVELDGERLDFLTLTERVNVLAGSFGLGRYEGLEEIEDGAKVQEVREMPAACVLFDAYRRLETGCVSSECIREKMHQEQIWVREAVEGRWYQPLRSAAQAFCLTVAEKVTGAITYDLSPNKLQYRGMKADRPLYIRDRTEYEKEETPETSAFAFSEPVAQRA